MARANAHALRLLGVILLLITLGAGLRWTLVRAGAGEIADRQAAAPAEIAARTPRHVGEASCAGCHPEQVKLHDKDAHARVPCEVCHGPGQQHAASPRSQRPRRPQGKAACLVCHQELAARAPFHPQIDPVAHYREVGVKDASVDCTRCHNPHEPLFMDRDLRTARLHPLIHRCRDCHTGSSRDPATPRPARHPAIFECSYCHAPVAADHAKRSHRKVACNTCHIFFKESEFAGRILRDADPRFCLLCHGRAEFRSDTAPPGIDWPKHREEMGGEPKQTCIECHRDQIHQPAQGAPHE